MNSYSKKIYGWYRQVCRERDDLCRSLNQSKQERVRLERMLNKAQNDNDRLIRELKGYFQNRAQQKEVTNGKEEGKEELKEEDEKNKRESKADRNEFESQLRIKHNLIRNQCETIQYLANQNTNLEKCVALMVIVNLVLVPLFFFYSCEVCEI